MVGMQNLTRKKALGTGPNSAVQAEYALDGNVLITVLKVWTSAFYCTCHLRVARKVSQSQRFSSVMLHDRSNDAKLRRLETYPQSAYRSLARPAVYAAG